MGNLFAELKRRHIYRVAAAYAVVAWVLIQLVNNVTPMLKLPDWVGTVVLVLLFVGFRSRFSLPGSRSWRLTMAQRRKRRPAGWIGH